MHLLQNTKNITKRGGPKFLTKIVKELPYTRLPAILKDGIRTFYDLNLFCPKLHKCNGEGTSDILDL